MERRAEGKVIPCGGAFSFCRAANLGIAAAGGEWILLLNDDVVPAPSFLERLVADVPDDDRIGMVCGKLLAPDGRTIDSTGQFLSRARTARERGHRAIDAGQFDVAGEVFSVPGAAALYRRRMLDSLVVGERQYFDERLSMYLEDLEFGWRAQRAGWRAYYVPGAIATHARGATAKRQTTAWPWVRRFYLPALSPKLQVRYILNRYRLIATYDTFLSLLRDSPWLLWYELRLWAYLLCLERRTLHLFMRVLRRPRLGV